MTKSILYHGFAADIAGVIVASSQATRAIDAATVVNVTAGAATLDVWIVADGQARSNSNKVLHELSINTGATSLAPFLANHAIPKGSTVHALASAASTLTLLISGRSQ